jgi:hypothetical protein
MNRIYDYNVPASPVSPCFPECARIRRMKKRLLLIVLAILPLAACDQVSDKLGLDDPVKKEADAKAVGGACRQSGRAIEDCYSIYTWLPKAGVYAGWREMDEYMRENKLETVTPHLPPAEPPGTKKRKPPPPAADASGEVATGNAAEPAGDKGNDKGGDKK